MGPGPRASALARDDRENHFASITRTGLPSSHAADVLDDVGEIFAVVLLADIAEMRRDHDIVELAVGMIERQRLDLEHVEAGAGDFLVLQGREQRRLDRRSAPREVLIR